MIDSATKRRSARVPKPIKRTLYEGSKVPPTRVRTTRAGKAQTETIDLEPDIQEAIAPNGESSLDISSTMPADESDSDEGESMDGFVVYSDESDEYEDSEEEETLETSPEPTPGPEPRDCPNEAMAPAGNRVTRGRNAPPPAVLPATRPLAQPTSQPAPQPVVIPTPHPAQPRPESQLKSHQETDTDSIAYRSIAYRVTSGLSQLAQAPVPLAESIRAPLDAYGEAIIRCSLDHTPSTASKLESDIVQASQNVVDYHKAAIVLANQDLQKQLTAKEDRLAWVVSMYEMLRDEEDEQSKEIRRKDKELKEKDMELRQFKNAQAAEEKKKEGEKVRLKEIEKEMEEKRKRVLESWEASKKAKM